MLSYIYRFHGHNSLQYVYKNGQAVRGQLLTIRYIKNPRRSTPRIAVVVSKKIHKGAVGRNRIRRRVYEWFRQELPNLGGVYDIVCVITSAEVRTIESIELQKILREQTRQLFAYTDKK